MSLWQKAAELEKIPLADGADTNFGGYTGSMGIRSTTLISFQVFFRRIYVFFIIYYVSPKHGSSDLNLKLP